MWDYCVNRPLSFPGYADEWDEDQWADHIEKVTKRIQSIQYLFDSESCDYWFGQHWRKSMRYTRHTSRQWMSRANYIMTCLIMPNHDWFHVADDDRNEGSTHHYVINNQGEVLDSQGLALQFNLDEYQKTFSDTKVSSDHAVRDRIDEINEDYRKLSLMLNYTPDCCPSAQG